MNHKIVGFLAGLALAAMLGVNSAGRAATTSTIVFNGDAILNQYTAGPTTGTLGARILYQNYSMDDPSGGPYTTTASTYNNPSDYASFVSGSGAVVSSFQLWMQGGAPDSSWGESIGMRPGLPAPAVSMPAGWSAQIVDSSTIYGSAAAGYWQVLFYTNTPADYIKVGSSVGNFSVTDQFAYSSGSDPYWPTNAQLGADVIPGNANAQIWFGLANGPSGDSTAPNQQISFPAGGWSEGWGSVDDTTGAGGTGLEGNLAATIQPTPGSFWTGAAANSTWATAGNWSGPVPGSTTGTTSIDTALFNQTVGTSPAVIDMGGRNVMIITFDTAAVSPMTIGTTAGPALILTAGGAIQTTSTVVNPQVVNAPLQLEGNYTFTSDALSSTATLSFGGAIMPDASLTSSPTTLTLSGTNTGANTIGGLLSDNGSARLAVSVNGAGVWAFSGATNTYSGGTTIASGATLELAGSVSTMSQSMNIANSGSLLVASSTNQKVGTILGTGSVTDSSGSLTAYQIRQNSLAIGSGATVTLSASGSGSTSTPALPNNINFSSSVTSLNIAGTIGAWTGTLDIGNNGLVIAYGNPANDPYTTIDNMIESGYNGGVWGGKGITSSLAQAGVAMNISTPLNIGLLDFTPGTGNYTNQTFLVFEGQTVTTNAILVRLTYMDDIVLAGDMAQNNSTSDALLFAANFGTGTTWSVGDLTHDGTIDSNDALLFAANFTVGLPSLDGTSGASAALASDAAAVPEPCSALLAAAGFLTLTLCARRRGRG